MPIATKDRFRDTNLRIPIGPVTTFPPEGFHYKDQEYVVLGESNKDDLIPVSADDLEMQKIVTFGNLGQYICSDLTGNIYDACFYKGEDESTYLFAISTREKPDKPKGKKGDA